MKARPPARRSPGDESTALPTPMALWTGRQENSSRGVALIGHVPRLIVLFLALDRTYMLSQESPLLIPISRTFLNTGAHHKPWGEVLLRCFPRLRCNPNRR